MTEAWKEVPGSAGWYEVSEMGRVRSFVSTQPDRRLATPKIVGSPPGRHPYARVRMSRPTDRSEYVHRLVLEAFVGSAPEGMECAHLNGDTSDNRLCNLRWVTRKENASHKVEHGTVMRGSRNPKATVDEADVRRIRRLHAHDDVPIKDLAAQYDMTYQGMWLIIRGHNFTHVPMHQSSGVK